VSTKAEEADQASIAFHLALTRIGIGTIEEALALWTDVNPTKVAATGSRWSVRAVALVMSRRRWSRDLAFSYYRLVRALRTGTTIADPFHPNEPRPTLSSLRKDFAGRVDEINRVSPQADTPAAPDSPQSDTSSDDEADRLIIEELKGLAAEEARLEKAAEEEARLNLEALGPANLESKLTDVGPTDAAEMDALREEAHREAGARQAAAAERLAMDGGRGALWLVGGSDKRCIGWVRVSRTGTPCGFCAMLISRGFTPKSGRYATRNTAGGQNLGYGASYDDGDLYHDNCHCYAEQIFSTAQLQGERFALNRKYAAEWPIVTKGLGGKDALSAWRKHIREQQQAQLRAAA
jgi:hypothetical protein